MRLPLKNEALINAIPDHREVQTFEEMLEQDISLGHYEALMEKQSIKKYCLSKLASLYNKEDAEYIFKNKSSKTIIAMLKECKNRTPGMEIKYVHINSRVNKSMLYSSEMKRTPKDVRALDQVIQGKQTFQRKGYNKRDSSYSNDVMRSADIPRNSPNISFSGLSNLKAKPMLSIRTNKTITQRKHPESRTAYNQIIDTKSSFANDSFIKAPNYKSPLTLQEMNEVIRRAEDYLGEKPLLKKVKAHSNRKTTNGTFIPAKSFPTYSKYSKEMDYKTFAILYRMRQRTNKQFYCSFSCS